MQPEQGWIALDEGAAIAVVLICMVKLLAGRRKVLEGGRVAVDRPRGVADAGWLSASVPVSPGSAGGGGWLEVVNRYRWVGDPRQGRFRVYLDGRAVGWAPLSGSLRVPVSAGPHVVRVRLWWYLSPRVGAGVGPGQAVRLEADIARELPVLQRMLFMMFRPFHSLSLTLAGASAGSGMVGDARTAGEHLGAGRGLGAPAPVGVRGRSSVLGTS